MNTDTISDPNLAYQHMFWTEMMAALGWGTTGREDVAAGVSENGYYGYWPDGRLKHHDWDDPVRLHYAEVA